MITLKNYINGELLAPAANAYIDNYNPATGKVYSLIPDSDERDVEMAVNAAQKAFAEWSVMPVDERSKILVRIASFINRDLEKLTLAESIDNGKPVEIGRAHV